MSDSGTFDAVRHPGVVPGTVVMLDEDGQVEWAGPLPLCPDTDNKTVLMSPVGFEEFRAHLATKRH